MTHHEVHEAMRIMKPTGHFAPVVMLDGKEGWIEEGPSRSDGLCKITVEVSRGKIDTRWTHHAKLEVIRNQYLREVA